MTQDLRLRMESLSDYGGFDEMKKDTLEVLFISLGLILIIAFPIGFGVFRNIISSRVESKLYNDKYGTHYTPSDFYWAGHTIKKRFHSQKEETYNLKVNQ